MLLVTTTSARTVPAASHVCRDCGAVISRHWTAACPVKGGGHICPLCYTKRMDADPDYERVTRPDGSVGYQRIRTGEKKGGRVIPTAPMQGD